MLLWQIIFWASLILLFYTYLGYFMLLYLWKSLVRTNSIDVKTVDYQQVVTHIIAAYNEQEVIEKKIKNTLNLDYPKSQIRNIIVADGSDDDTVEIIKNYPDIDLFYEKDRRGKLASVNRVIPRVDSDIIIFSDANAMLSKNSISSLVAHFKDDNIGAVAGEKRVVAEVSDDAASSGESMYWKYESLIKKWESDISSTVGAAGELFAIRTQLYQSPPNHILVEDFMTTTEVLKRGYQVVYETEATASELPSKNIVEEVKRKIRISAGGIQSIPFLIPLLNVFKYGSLSIFLFSHKFLRWLVAPSALLLLFISSAVLLLSDQLIIKFVFWVQLIFYILALIGWILSSKSLNIRMIFWPFYFVVMHLCIVMGYKKALFGKGDVLWEKAERRIQE